MSLHRALIAILAAPLIAGVAWATTYNVTADGTGAASLAYANANAVSTDVVLMADGVYFDPIRPVHGGASGAGNRISFVGNIATPENVSVAFVNVDSLNGATGYISVTGVGSRAGIDLNAFGPQVGHYDSILYCHSKTGFGLTGRGNVTVRYCVLGDSLYYDDRLTLTYNRANRNPENSHYVTGLSFLDNTVYIQTGTAENAWKFRCMRDGTIARNRFHGMVVTGASGSSIVTAYCVQGMTFTDNYLEGVSLTASEPASYLFNFRDSNRFNTFVRDTFVEQQGGVATLKAGMATSGTVVGLSGDVGDRSNLWDGCFVKVRGLIEMQTPVPATTIRNCTLVSGYTVAMSNAAGGATDSLTFRHNTVAGFGTPSQSVFGGIGGLASFTNGIFAHNIFYGNADFLNDHGDQSVAAYGSFNPGAVDTNLYYSVGANDSLRAIGTTYAAPQGGGGGSTHQVRNWYGTLDANSKWGSPSFNDATFWSFNPAISLTGLAKSADWADGYVGAIAPAVADVTAPALAVTWPPSAQVLPLRTQILFGWTASDAVGVVRVDITYSNAQNGTVWLPAYSTVVNVTSGSYRWRIPANLISSDLWVRLRAFDAAGNVVESKHEFTVIPNPEIDNDPFLDGF